MFCSRCGKAASDDMRFCPLCGTPLMIPAAAPAVPPVMPPSPPPSRPPLPPTVLPTRPLPGPKAPPRKSRVGLFLLIAALVAIPLILLLAGGAIVAYFYWQAVPSSPKPSTPIVTPVDPITKPAPAPATQRFTKRAGGDYEWRTPGNLDTASLFFDNGSADPLSIDVEHGGTITVDPGQRAALSASVGDLSIAITGGDSAAEQYNIHLEPRHTYIYNPHAAWDYSLETHVYSSLGLGPKPEKETLQGLVLFDAGDIDYPFLAAPDTITMIGIGSETRLSLAHSGSAHDDRSVRLARTSSGMVRIVTVPDGPYVVQSTTDLARPASVRVDNPYNKALDLLVDGTSICSIDADGDEEVCITPGDHALAARAIPAAHLECALKPGAKYVWEPEGRRSFFLDYQYYGSTLLNPQKRDPITFRGLVFFEVHTDFAFEPFPTTADLSAMEIAGAWRSRLDWGDTGATESDVIDDLTAVEKSARDELPAAKLRIFQQRLPRRHSPVNDCDLHLARALFLGLKGDFKGAQTLFDALSPVNPDDAQRSRIEGLMDYDRKNYVDAQLELERAVELDATLSAELKPIIDECAKAPPPP